ncbi:MAG: phosphoglycerate mutase [Rhodobacterales bacterium]|nr:MAG: phosphoglycerate mutase [Rhodobacterales bacterium]
MKLILIRHAKSSWDDLNQDDHDRPLNDRGRRAAPRIGQWLADHDHRPELVLCSSAARTQETFARMKDALGGPRLELRPDLYHAAPAHMLDLLHGQTADSIALIAHNPGIGDLAQRLAAELPEHPRFLDYPTAATTVFEIDSWADIAPHTARVIGFVTPRDLA